jgi:hypothetical protein
MQESWHAELGYACWVGDLHLVQRFVSLGASVHFVDQNGHSALMSASCPSIARFLLEQGADPEHVRPAKKEVYEKASVTKVLEANATHEKSAKRAYGCFVVPGSIIRLCTGRISEKLRVLFPLGYRELVPGVLCD